MSLDPNKTYLVWNGTEFPNSTNAQFKAPAGSTIDWGDGKSDEFSTETAPTHTYDDGKTEHTIAISELISIGEWAFKGCGSLTSVIIGNRITIIDYGAFSGCSSLTSITIPNSVTSIGGAVFADCVSLTSITIPNSVTSISGSAFSGCSSLTSITIPNSVTRINSYAFYDCSSLTSVTIGNSVTSIGDKAFYNCSELTQLILFPSTPPDLSSNAIPSNVQLIYVQQSFKAVYQVAMNWKAFASKIVSDNIYLSFVRFNQKNKEYIDAKIDKLKQYIDNKIAELTSNNV